jgi:histone H3/H4
MTDSNPIVKNFSDPGNFISRMSDSDSDSDIEQSSEAIILGLQASLQHSIERMVKNAADRPATSGFISSLSLLTCQFVQNCVARDLLAFREHAGRKTMSEEDVILISRKSPFHEHMKAYLKNQLGVAKPSPVRSRKLDSYRV